MKEKLGEREKLREELNKIRQGLRLLNQTAQTISDLTETVRTLLSAFTREGLLETGIEVIGSWCFFLYQKYLPIERYPLRTQDIDILVPIPYQGRPVDISSLFNNLGFEEHFTQEAV